MLAPFFSWSSWPAAPPHPPPSASGLWSLSSPPYFAPIFTSLLSVIMKHLRSSAHLCGGWFLTLFSLYPLWRFGFYSPSVLSGTGPFLSGDPFFLGVCSWHGWGLLAQSLPGGCCPGISWGHPHLKVSLRPEGLPPRWLTHVASKLVLAVDWGSCFFSMWAPPQGCLSLLATWQLISPLKDSILSTLHTISLILRTSIRAPNNDYLHFSDAETRVQREEVTCPSQGHS